MKKVAVISSNGRVGRLIVAELVKRGFEVTGFGRDQQNQSSAQTYVQTDLFDLNKADLAGFDAVISAFGTFAPETFHLHSQVVTHLSDLLSGSKTRLLVVGGAGSLYVNADHSLQLVDTPDFPEAYYPLAKAQSQALDVLRQRNDVQWTFVSPAADFQADGEATGQYILAGEEFTLNSRNESMISYADYATGLVDELEKGSHLQERISLVRA